MLYHPTPSIPTPLQQIEIAALLQTRKLTEVHQPGSGSWDSNAGRLTPNPTVVTRGERWAAAPVPRGSDDQKCLKPSVGPSRGKWECQPTDLLESECAGYTREIKPA